MQRPWQNGGCMNDVLELFLNRQRQPALLFGLQTDSEPGAVGAWDRERPCFGLFCGRGASRPHS